MNGKKHVPVKSAEQPKRSHTSPGLPTPIKKTNQDQSFWNGLLEKKTKLFLYQKICVFLVAFLVFANGIQNGFNIDDNYYTTKENTVSTKGIKAIPVIFTTHTFKDNSNNSFDYRPIAMLSFALQHQFLSDTPATSHFISVFIYSFICLLVFVLLCLWFGPAKNWFVFFVTLLYAVHPLHTEVVDNIKNRDELLATLFCLLSMISAWKWHLTGKARYMVLSVFLLIIGLLCKNTIITYVAIMPIAFYFFTDMPVRKIILFFVILFISFALFIGLTKDHLLPKEHRSFLFFENPMYAPHLSLGIKTATASYILGWYSYLHIIPYPLSFYYGYTYVRLLHWNNLLPVLSLILYLTLIFLAVKNVHKKSIAAFGALFYLVCLLPYSNLFGPAPGMMAERFTFASSLGYCILLVSFLYYLCKIIPGFSPINKNSKYLLASFLCIFISYAAMSIARNTEWENNWVLYSHDIQHLQNSAKANMLYGEEIISKSNHYRQAFDQASGEEKQIYRDSMLQYQAEEKQIFKRTLAIVPDFNKALNDLAVAYIHEDSFEEAKKYLLQARALTPLNSDDILHYNLGIVYRNLGINDHNISLIDSSVNEFKTAIGINPNYQTAYKSLSLTYLINKDTISALNTLLSGIKNIPDQSFLYEEIAKVYLYKKDTAHGIYYFEKGAQVSRPDPWLFQLLQRYYHSKNDTQKENFYRNKENTINAETN